MKRHHFTFGNTTTSCKKHFLIGINSKHVTMSKAHVTCAACRKALGLKPLSNTPKEK